MLDYSFRITTDENRSIRLTPELVSINNMFCMTAADIDVTFSREGKSKEIVDRNVTVKRNVLNENILVTIRLTGKLTPFEIDLIRDINLDGHRSNIILSERTISNVIHVGYYANSKLLSMCQNVPKAYIKRLATIPNSNDYDMNLVVKRSYNNDNGLIEKILETVTNGTGIYDITIFFTMDTFNNNLSKLQSVKDILES